MNGSSICRSGGVGLRLAAAVALACLATFDTTVTTLDADRTFSQYIRDRWGPALGFSGGPVNSIAQTADGYLWVGAEKGLFRFDGLTFRAFDPGLEAGSGRAVLGLVGAHDGSLWARVRGIALFRYQDGVFRNVLPDIGSPESVASALVQGPEESLLLATLGRGAVRYRQGRFAAIAEAKALPTSSFVIAIAAAADGDIWLGTRDAGLFRVGGGRTARFTERLPDLKINCLLAGDHGEIWIGTDRGIVKWNGTEITTSGVPAALHQAPALHMIRDREANVWIAAGAGGLLRMSPDGTVRSTSDQKWALGHVTTVFEDREGNLWVGTDQGLERWRDPVFTTYSVAQGMPSDAVGPVHADQSGDVWFGPSTGGLFTIRDGVIREVTETDLSRDVVYSIHGRQEDIWVGSQRGGITRLRVQGGTIRARRFTERDGLSRDTVFAIHQARDGAVWAGTLTGGVSLLRGDRFVSYDTTNGLPSNTVASILEGGDGTMWFGTPGGLSAFSHGGWRTFTIADGLPANDINALFEDRAGVIWVGTAKGIAIVEGGRLRSVDAAAPQLHGSVLGFAEDRHGGLWVNVVDRVVRVDRESLLHGVLREGNVREYGAADGLLGVESLKRHVTVVSDRRGRIWFALTRGLSVADPSRTEARGTAALTVVEEIAADGALVDPREPIRIPSSRRRITFTYAGLSLSVPERVKFRYRLDGFDGDWSGPVAERQAVYTNLSPGEYRFRVMASNHDGLWNGAEASLPFEIRPMYWQTGWFQASAIAFAGIAGWGVYRLRVRQVARRLSERFEERLAERTHIAQELHDTLLQGFVSASMQLHVAVERLPDDSPAKSSLGRVLDLMRTVTDEGRNAVRGLRWANTAAEDLQQVLAGVQQEVGASDATFRVIVEGRPQPLKPLIRDEVYRVAREALVNAFRHSGASHIEVELEYGLRELSVFVRDDGRGMDADIMRLGTDGHWGVTGMRERARRIGGTLKIRSRAAAGTEVELRVPARVAFERQASGWARFLPGRFRESADVSRAETTENR